MMSITEPPRSALLAGRALGQVARWTLFHLGLLGPRRPAHHEGGAVVRFYATPRGVLSHAVRSRERI